MEFYIGISYFSSLSMTSFVNFSFDRTRFMIALAIFLGQPFQDVNFFIDWGSFERFSFEHIFFAQSTSNLIETIFHFH